MPCIRSPLTWLIAVAAVLIGVVGCSNHKEKKVITTADAGDKSAPEGPRFDLRWAQFSDHPAHAAVEHCHLVDEVELNLLRYVADKKEINPDEVAPIFGDHIDPDADEFDKKRQRDAVAAKVSARLAELRNTPLCVRRDIVVQDYDFEAQGFGFPSQAISVAFDNRRASAERWISRLETKTQTRRPDGFNLPAVLLAMPAPPFLPVAEAQAESILKKLPKTKAAIDAERDGDKPARRQQAGPARFGSVLSRMEPEAVRAAIYAEEHTDQRPSARPVGKVFSSIGDHVRQLPKGRKVNAVLVFRPRVSFAHDYTEAGVDFELTGVAAHLTKLVAATADGQVFSVLPTLSERQAKRMGTRVDIDRDTHDPILEKACRRGVTTDVDTTVDDGELVDVRTPICRRCPRGAADKWGHPELADLMFGSFTDPGAIQAVIRTDGCESMATGAGGLTLVEQDVAGDWERLNYAAAPFSSPKIVRDPDGRDLLVHRSQRVNGGVASGSMVATSMDVDDVDQTRLFPLYDNRGACDKKYLIINPKTTERTDINGDGVLDVTFEVDLRRGRRRGDDCDFGDNDRIAPAKTLSVSYVVQHGELSLAEGSKDAHATLEQAVNEVQ